jgi:putative Mg2+ transporter-C (MgtC) family protein
VNPLHPLTPLQFIVRLLLGACLGVIIGLERQRRSRAAGAHTTALIVTGATLFATIEPLLGEASTARVLANVVTGVGFLAGGVILKEGTNIRGLNTAATLWSSAAIGAFAGVGLYWEAAVGALIIVTVNLTLEPLATAVGRSAGKGLDTLYVLSIECLGTAEPAVRRIITDRVSHDKELALQSLSTATEDDRLRIRVELLLPRRDDPKVESLTHEVSAALGVTKTEWRVEDA